MDPLWSETCWSTFKYLIILIVSTYYILCMCWIIKCLNTKKLFLFIVRPISEHLIWKCTANIDRYTRRPHPCDIVLWQGFLNSPSTWVKHFTLPCITLYPLLHGQSHIPFCQMSCHACRHSVLAGVTVFQKCRGKEQIRAADKITVCIVVYSIWIRWIHYRFSVHSRNNCEQRLLRCVPTFCSHGTPRHAAKRPSSVTRILTKYFDQIKFWSTSAKQ